MFNSNNSSLKRRKTDSAGGDAHRNTAFDLQRGIVPPRRIYIAVQVGEKGGIVCAERGMYEMHCLKFYSGISGGVA